MKTIFIEKESIGEAWATAVLHVFYFGKSIKTEYDNPADFPSKDVTALISVTKPLSKPLRGYKDEIYTHMGDLYGIESIKSGYLEEIVNGTHDHEIGKGESYPYTYHNRITNYKNEKFHESYYKKGINQLDHIIEKLKQNNYSRRAQAITWKPDHDLFVSDPPCLQRLWARVVDDKLVFETTWRSRDLFRAWGANVNGMVAWAKIIADALNVELDCYIDFSNSLHIYGKKKLVIEVTDFIDRLMKREANKYDSIYREAYQDFKNTKFYELYSIRNEMKLSKEKSITEKEKEELQKSILNMDKQIDLLKSYN